MTVGSCNAPSYYGTYDMSGNVCEWCDALYQGEQPVARGAMMTNNAVNLTSLQRYGYYNRWTESYIGFRVGRP